MQAIDSFVFEKGDRFLTKVKVFDALFCKQLRLNGYVGLFDVVTDCPFPITACCKSCKGPTAALTLQPTQIELGIMQYNEDRCAVSLSQRGFLILARHNVSANFFSSTANQNQPPIMAALYVQSTF
jgi:hypothetical protein